MNLHVLVCPPTFWEQKLQARFLTPAWRLHVPGVGVYPEVIALLVAVKVQPHPVALHLWGEHADRQEEVAVNKETIRTYGAPLDPNGAPDSHMQLPTETQSKLSYLSHSQHTEEGRVHWVQTLQLHAHFEAVSALRE